MSFYESASEEKFTLEILKSDVSKTAVVSFSTHEEMSSPYLVDVILTSYKEKMPFENVLGKDALLSIETSDESRIFHGIIAKFRRAGKQGDYYLYQAQIVPYLSLLGLSTDCRIFQGKTVVDMVKDIFKKHNIADDRLEVLSLQNSHIERDYCVQYRETDLDFISRILAEEGIFYYFKHSSDKHVMVIGDNPMNYMEISGETIVTYKESGGMKSDGENISGFDVSKAISPSNVVHKDYNFEKASLKQKGTAEEESDFKFEVFDYPGKFQSPEKGEQLANIHLETLNTFQENAEGTSVCPRLASGAIFSMDKGNAKQYLAVSVIHSGYQPQVLKEQASEATGKPYFNDFLAIPATVTYRPGFHPKPTITGLQSAIVVGPKGEEIHTDDHGRVRVQFHWDRHGKKDDKSSCWLRVAQAWGGGGFGAQFIPRIGDEVLVDFLEGDPDRPIVTGCVYNSDNQPINNLKQSVTQSGFRTKTHKGEGFNELRFDDKNGAEEIFIHAQKDWNITVKDSKSQAIGGSSSTTVAKSLSETAEDITLTAKSKITLVCGGSTIIIDSSGISIKGGKINLNE